MIHFFAMRHLAAAAGRPGPLYQRAAGGKPVPAGVDKNRRGRMIGATATEAVMHVMVRKVECAILAAAVVFVLAQPSEAG